MSFRPIGQGLVAAVAVGFAACSITVDEHVSGCTGSLPDPLLRFQESQQSSGSPVEKIDALMGIIQCDQNDVEVPHWVQFVYDQNGALCIGIATSERLEDGSVVASDDIACDERPLTAREVRQVVEREPVPTQSTEVDIWAVGDEVQGFEVTRGNGEVARVLAETIAGFRLVIVSSEAEHGGLRSVVPI